MRVSTNYLLRVYLRSISKIYFYIHVNGCSRTILPTIYGLEIHLPIIYQLFCQLFMSMFIILPIIHIILPIIHYCLVGYEC